MEWTSRVRANIASTYCWSRCCWIVLQSRACADGGSMPLQGGISRSPIGEISRTVKLNDNRFKTAKQGQKHEVLLK